MLSGRPARRTNKHLPLHKHSSQIAFSCAPQEVPLWCGFQADDVRPLPGYRSEWLQPKRYERLRTEATGFYESSRAVIRKATAAKRKPQSPRLPITLIRLGGHRYRTLLFIPVIFHGIPASALTVSFDDVEPAIKPIGTSPDTYIENGVIASSLSGLGYWSRIGAIHLDGSGTGITSTVEFTIGGLFNPVSFDVFALGTSVFSDILNLVDGAETWTWGLPYDDVRILGLRNGAQVAEERLSNAAFPTLFLPGFKTRNFVRFGDVCQFWRGLPDNAYLALRIGNFDLILAKGLPDRQVDVGTHTTCTGFGVGQPEA